MTQPQDIHEYDTVVQWTGERRGMLSLEGRPDITVGTPTEFGGHPDVVSPEDRFVASVATCLLTTFFTIAQKRKLTYKAITSHGHGVLERDANHQRRFTRLILRPRIVVGSADDVKNAQKTIELAEKLCLVSNSINSEITLEPEIVVEG